MLDSLTTGYCHKYLPYRISLSHIYASTGESRLIETNYFNHLLFHTHSIIACTSSLVLYSIGTVVVLFLPLVNDVCVPLALVAEVNVAVEEILVF